MRRFLQSFLKCVTEFCKQKPSIIQIKYFVLPSIEKNWHVLTTCMTSAQSKQIVSNNSVQYLAKERNVLNEWCRIQSASEETIHGVHFRHIENWKYYRWQVDSPNFYFKTCNLSGDHGISEESNLRQKTYHLTGRKHPVLMPC